MKTILSIIFTLQLMGYGLAAQNTNDSVFFTEKFLRYEFRYQNSPMSVNQISALLENNYEAYDLFETGREAKVFGIVFSGLGTTLILIPFVTSLTESSPNWAFTYAGMGFVGLSVPMFYSYHKKTEVALELYNSGLANPPKKTTQANTLNFGFTNSGIGMAFQF
jgi:hypothetical protein